MNTNRERNKILSIVKYEKENNNKNKNKTATNEIENLTHDGLEIDFNIRIKTSTVTKSSVPKEISLIARRNLISTDHRLFLANCVRKREDRVRI